MLVNNEIFEAKVNESLVVFCVLNHNSTKLSLSYPLCH
jgi:hypothetical protein